VISLLYSQDQGGPGDPVAEFLEHRSSDSVGLVLQSVILDLPEDAQIDLVARVWPGRDEAS
jgi:hypothetical protein